MHDDDEDDPEFPDASDMEAPGDTDLLDPCPNCHRLMYDDAERCPHCGHYRSDETDAPRDSRWVIICALVLLLFLALVWLR